MLLCLDGTLEALFNSAYRYHHWSWKKGFAKTIDPLLNKTIEPKQKTLIQLVIVVLIIVVVMRKEMLDELGFGVSIRFCYFLHLILLVAI